MNHEAIYATHSTVVRIDDNADGTVTCYDANDAVVTVDTAVYQPKATEIDNARNLKALRRERDKRLVETDHWVLSDTATATQAQLDYRQALRDITDTYTSLDDVVWPEKP